MHGVYRNAHVCLATKKVNNKRTSKGCETDSKVGVRVLKGSVHEQDSYITTNSS